MSDDILKGLDEWEFHEKLFWWKASQCSNFSKHFTFKEILRCSLYIVDGKIDECKEALMNNRVFVYEGNPLKFYIGENEQEVDRAIVQGL